MKVHYLKSATTIIESKGVKILTDPWLVDGEYYGSWFHYPPFEFRPADFEDIDFIYISHIHPDHFSRDTLKQLDRNIPVLIHNYQAKFLKRNIELLGFSVRELEHNVRTPLKNGVGINILAADNCNPELCGKFFGCAQAETKIGSTQIDSLALVDDGQYKLLNLNDCPIGLARSCAETILKQYGTVDFLLVGYAGAGPYPQCFANLTAEEKSQAAQRKKAQFLKQGLDYLELFQPRFFMPFAGTYTLGGKHTELNDSRGVPSLEEALEYYREYDRGNGLLLNSGSYFDLKTETATSEYVPVNLYDRQVYLQKVLSQKGFDFEADPMPRLEDFEPLIPLAYERMNRVRDSIGFESATKVVIPVLESRAIIVSMNGNGWEWASCEQAEGLERFTRFAVDSRLLLRILKGPRWAHWNNAEIGSHIEFFRKPDEFERGLNHCMNFFFAGEPQRKDASTIPHIKKGLVTLQS